MLETLKTWKLLKLDCILHYKINMRLCGQGIEHYGLRVMCLVVKLTGDVSCDCGFDVT